MIVKAVVHLASGQSVSTELDVPEELEDDEVRSEVVKTLTGDARPGWRAIGDVIAFSQAVSAVEILDLIP